MRITGLNREFGANRVLNDLDLDIERGSFVALLGRSGSGKSTLLRTLAGLDPAPPGTLTVPERLSVVFQEPRLVPWKTVQKNVLLGLRDPDAEARVQATLREVNIEHRAQAWPLTLSGGEAQRVALARALIRDPELLLLDEPFAALDALTRLQMQALVAQLWKAHETTILLVTHDVDEALLLADRILILEHGGIGRDVEVNLPRPRHHAASRFTQLRNELLESLGVVVDS